MTLMVAMMWLTRRSPSKNNEDGKANIRQLPEIILNVRRIINEIIKIQQSHQCDYYAIALIHMHVFQNSGLTCYVNN